MATASLTIPKSGGQSRSLTRAGARRRFPVENTLLFLLAIAMYLTAASYLVFHVHYMIDDAYARIDNAFDVLFTRDPHLAAIGFVWPPLPSFLELPIIAFKGVWPALVNQGFAGSILASIFSAGTVVLINSGLRWAGVVRGMRWVFCLVWIVNPMTLIYATQGMSEAEFIFFAVAAILVFLRWCDSRRAALLPLMGILAGLGCLCRNEMIVLTVFMGVGVIVRSVRWRLSLREVETYALMFGLPALLMIMLWLGSMTIIMHDPLYWLHVQGYGNAAAASAAATVGGNGGGGITVDTWSAAINFVISHSLALYPAVIAALGMLGAHILVRRDRVTGFILVALAFPIALVDIYLLRKGSLAPTLRYQIFVIPYTFIVFIYVLRYLRSRNSIFSSWAALGMVVVLGLSNIVSAGTLGDPTMSTQESPLIAALTTNRTLEQLNLPSAIDAGMALAPKVAALASDHGLIACDSTVCFPIILNAADPKQYVVTSDRDFQAVINQPQVYHVEYFLVMDPARGGGRDELNDLYPDLYQDGGGFSVLVGQAGAYRLYRIVGPTGRG